MSGGTYILIAAGHFGLLGFSMSWRCPEGALTLWIAAFPALTRRVFTGTIRSSRTGKAGSSSPPTRESSAGMEADGSQLARPAAWGGTPIFRGWSSMRPAIFGCLAGGGGLYNWVGYEDWEGWGDAQDLPSTIIWSIHVGPDRILAGTEHGPVWIDRRNGSASPLTSHPWIYGQIESIGTNDDGSLWVGTFAGSLVRIDPRTGVTKRMLRLSSHLFGSLQLSPQRILFSTAQGLLEWDGHAALRRIPAVDALLGDSYEANGGCTGPASAPLGS